MPGTCCVGIMPCWGGGYGPGAGGIGDGGIGDGAHAAPLPNRAELGTPCAAIAADAGLTGAHACGGRVWVACISACAIATAPWNRWFGSSAIAARITASY